MLVFFDYPASLIVGAFSLIYLFYSLIAALAMLAVYAIATPPIRARLRRTMWVIAIIPAYRMLIFVFRLAGSLITLTEPAEWRTQNPWDATRVAWHSLWQQTYIKLRTYFKV